MLPLLLSPEDSFLSNWKYTHFLFNYAEGFVKRGLVGEILRQTTSNISFTLVWKLSVLLLTVIYGILFAVFARPWWRERTNAGLFLFLLIAITSSATLQHAVFDLGRFDLLCLLLALGCIACSGHLSLSTLGSVLLVNSCLLLSLLIHEAAFFLYVPLVLAFWHMLDPSARGCRRQLLSAVFLMIATWIISTRGQMTLNTLQVHTAQLQAIYGSRVESSALLVLHRQGIAENIRLTLDNGFTVARLISHLIMLLALFPLFKLLWHFYRACRTVLISQQKLLLLSSFSPLALYPLGYDHFRWWALALTNLFIVLSLLMTWYPPVRTRIAAAIMQHKTLVWLTIASSLLFGPLAVTESFDFLLWYSTYPH